VPDHCAYPQAVTGAAGLLKEFWGIHNSPPASTNKKSPHEANFPDFGTGILFSAIVFQHPARKPLVDTTTVVVQ
jgi:hypothetical protein